MKKACPPQLAGVVRIRRLSDQIYDLLLEQIRNGDFPIETAFTESTEITRRVRMVDNDLFKYAAVAPRTINMNDSVSF